MAMTLKRVTVRLDHPRAVVLADLSDILNVGEAEIMRVALDALVSRVPPGFFDTPHACADETVRVTQSRYTQSLTRIGNNLNQLVRAGHRDDWPSTVRNDISSAVREVRAGVREARDGVRHAGQ